MYLKNLFRYSVVLALLGGVTAFSSAYYEDFSDWNTQGNELGGSWDYTYDYGSSNTSDTNGWDILGQPSSGIDLVGGGYQAAGSANDGEWIDLAGSPGPGGISQSFTLTQGQSYTMSFSGFSNDGNGFDVEVNGSPIDFYSADDLTSSWTTHSVTFSATSPTTDISFYTTDASLGNVGLDSVSIQPAPEPVTIVLVGGIFATAIKRRLSK